MVVVTTRTIIPIAAKKSLLDGDTNVDARIEHTNDRGTPFEMTFHPRNCPPTRADWPRAKGRATHTSLQTRYEEDGDDDTKGDE
jgi:galactose mutarotase-like enzyme